jgi:hypothetical protein
MRLSCINFNADDAGDPSDASDVIDGSASRTNAYNTLMSMSDWVNANPLMSFALLASA